VDKRLTIRFTGPAQPTRPKPDRDAARAPVQPLVRLRVMDGQTLPTPEDQASSPFHPCVLRIDRRRRHRGIHSMLPKPGRHPGQSACGARPTSRTPRRRTACRRHHTAIDAARFPNCAIQVAQSLRRRAGYSPCQEVARVQLQNTCRAAPEPRVEGFVRSPHRVLEQASHRHDAQAAVEALQLPPPSVRLSSRHLAVPTDGTSNKGQRQ
jgi:hypothetical protein